MMDSCGYFTCANVEVLMSPRDKVEWRKENIFNTNVEFFQQLHKPHDEKVNGKVGFGSQY